MQGEYIKALLLHKDIDGGCRLFADTHDLEINRAFRLLIIFCVSCHQFLLCLFRLVCQLANLLGCLDVLGEPSSRQSVRRRSRK